MFSLFKRKDSRTPEEERDRVANIMSLGHRYDVINQARAAVDAGLAVDAFRSNILERAVDQVHLREFTGAKAHRLNQDFVTTAIKTNKDIQKSHQILITRSRELAKNSSDYRKWLAMTERNVIGSTGIRLQMRVKRRDPMTGEMVADKAANDLIEDAWKEFNRKGNCTVRGNESGRDLDKRIVRNWRVDGEVFIRRVVNKRYPFLIAYQLLDPLACPVTMNAAKSYRHGKIEHGIEVDDYGRPTHYWFLSGNSSDWAHYDAVPMANGMVQAGNNYARIPADEINHVFTQEFNNQRRGFPFGQAAMQNIYSLGGYFYTELVAADAASRKMGFYKPPAGKSGRYGGRSSSEDNRDPKGGTSDDPKKPVQYTLNETSEPATFGVLPDGWDFQSYDPTHPHGNFEPFTRGQKRNIANGLDVAYNIFANDLVGVNFSSIRTGILDERDAWMDSQVFIIEHVKQVEFEHWLELWLMMKSTVYGPGDLARLHKDGWRPRRWPWVDPYKDARANFEQMRIGTKAPQDIAEEQGYDWDENMEKFKKAEGDLETVATVMAMISAAGKGETPAKSSTSENGENQL